MPPVGFEPAIPAGKQLHTHAFECATTQNISYLFIFYPHKGYKKALQYYIIRTLPLLLHFCILS
jgi:hypothetical protein